MNCATLKLRGVLMLRGVSLRAVAPHSTPKSHAPRSIDVSLLDTQEHLVITGGGRSGAQTSAGGPGFLSKAVGQ